MKPIENAWGLIKRRLRERPNPLQNVNELFVALREEWNKFTDDYVRRLVLSMRCRVTALFAAVAATPDINFILNLIEGLLFIPSPNALFHLSNFVLCFKPHNQRNDAWK